MGDRDGPPFALAGLWRDDPLVEGPADTMVMTTPNALVATIHPTRMPVILPPERYEAWLTGPANEALVLIEPYPPRA